MKIHAIEWADVNEAFAAIQRFPFCGECKHAVKVQHINGRALTVCSHRPHCHRGIRDSVKEE